MATDPESASRQPLGNGTATTLTSIPDVDLAQLGLTEEGVRYVLDVATSPASRKVGTSRKRNLIADVAIHGLGHTLQAESQSGEHLFLIDITRDKTIRAIFDQPEGLPIQIVDASGRRTRARHTADYLVIDTTGVTAYEIKNQKELDRLCATRPHDWQLHEGGYRFLPGIAAFSALGIRHVTVSTCQLNSTRADNFRLLSLSRRAPETRGSAKKRYVVAQIVRNEEAIRGAAVLERLETNDSTAILQCIDAGTIFAAVDIISLSTIDQVWLASSQAKADILQAGDNRFLTHLRRQDEPISDWVDAKYEKTVAWRLAAIHGEVNLQAVGEGAPSERTIRRYRKIYSESGDDPLALTPKWSRCGCQGSKLSSIHRAFLQTCISEARGDSSCPSISKAFAHYQLLFQEQESLFVDANDQPVNRSTFYRYWHELPNVDLVAARRGGRRLANLESNSFDPRGRTLVATRPFSVAHIDHWKVDLFIVVGSVAGKRLTARPWLTAMVDSFTGEVLALWLSFSDPSRKACSMVIRDCVRRHGRLPEIVVTDGGPEFHSPHFLLMLASVGVTRVIRPPEDPRFGSEVERLFGSLKTSLAKGTPGYGLSIEEARSVSGSMKSSMRARLDLLQAYIIFEKFTFVGYNQYPKPGLATGRSELRDEYLSRIPWCGVSVKTDLRFLIATSIEASRDLYTLTDGRGIHVNDLWYSAPRLLNYRGYKKDIAVRLEPYDHSVIYVCIDGKWLVCHSSLSKLNGAKTDRAMIAAATEFYDLQAMRKAIQQEMNMVAAKVINDTLQGFSDIDADGSASHSSGLEMQ